MVFSRLFSGAFIEVIQWLDSTNDTLVYRFPTKSTEIKNGAKLTVRPGQMAVFVNEGRIADIFAEGLYELSTQNLPILSNLLAWKHGFNSPFKADIYFFSTRMFGNLKWGTPNPILMRDQELGNVRIRAFGSYSIQIQNPEKVLRMLVGTDDCFQIDEIQDKLRSQVLQSFATWIASCGILIFDLAGNYKQLGEKIRDSIQPDFSSFGIKINDIQIENISFPPEVEQAIDKRLSVQMMSGTNPTAYAQVKMAENPSSGNTGSMAMQAMMGMQMAQNIQNQMQNQPPSMPPPLQQPQWYAAIHNQQVGPLTIDQLFLQIQPDTLVWTQGMPQWIAAKEVPQLKVKFSSMPPPLP